MKLSSKIFLLFILVFAGLGSGCIYSTGGEKIIKVADFPNKPEFQRELKNKFGGTESVHINAGYVWKQTTFFWCPVFNEKGRYIGHIGSDTQYLSLEPTELKQMASKAEVVLPESPQLPFWDAIGGKLVGVMIVLVMVLIYVVRTLAEK